MPRIGNAMVYALGNSIRVSKFPMLTDAGEATEAVTQRVTKLANAKSGSGHDCFLKGIIFQCDLTFSNKAWVEMERYHFCDIVSSQSTMHKISAMDFDTAFNKYVSDNTKRHLKRLQRSYQQDPTPEKYLELLYNTPSGLELTAGITTNYLQLKTIYAQRRTHRLPDWQMFCDAIEKLPMSELITGKKDGE